MSVLGKKKEELENYFKMLKVFGCFVMGLFGIRMLYFVLKGLNYLLKYYIV